MKILLKYILISTMSIGATLGVTEVILPLVNEDTITVTFDTQGGTFIEPLEITSDTSLDVIPEPSKEGYIFDGFYLNDEKIDDTTIFYEDALLTAKYIKATYIITLNTSGSPLESIEATYLEEITLPEDFDYSTVYQYDFDYSK